MYTLPVVQMYNGINVSHSCSIYVVQLASALITKIRVGQVLVHTSSGKK
jgi:hypothetical protein